MKLIIGGAYQGKSDYALTRFDFTRDDVWFCDENTPVPDTSKPVICGFEKWVLALIRGGTDVHSALTAILPDIADKIIITDDISSGVVPADPVLRAWRDETGRATVFLAQQADEVIRMFAGIPTRLK
jgi:adenosyl cobinamide kinase/adenosyl cobinamide phosphate guanylyltransferase